MAGLEPIVIARRFNGPPGSGNGGYVAGLLAARLDAPSVEVTLRAPPPLDTVLQVHGDGAGGLALRHGDTVLAQAVGAPFTLVPPPLPTFEQAAAAGAIGRLRAAERIGNPYRRCFGCGIDRSDGLRLIPSPVGDDGVVACDWTPDAALAGPDGTLPAALVWAALDCPAGIAWTYRLPAAPPLVTGRITARIERTVPTGVRCMVLGWPIVQDGRKLHAGTAILDDTLGLLACSLQLWLLPRTPSLA